MRLVLPIQVVFLVLLWASAFIIARVAMIYRVKQFQGSFLSWGLSSSVSCGFVIAGKGIDALYGFSAVIKMVGDRSCEGVLTFDQAGLLLCFWLWAFGILDNLLKLCLLLALLKRRLMDRFIAGSLPDKGMSGWRGWQEGGFGGLHAFMVGQWRAHGDG